MKFSPSIAAILFLVPAAVWLSLGTLETERRLDVSPGPNSRSLPDRPDPETFVSPPVDAAEPRGGIVAGESTRRQPRIAPSTSPETPLASPASERMLFSTNRSRPPLSVSSSESGSQNDQRSVTPIIASFARPIPKAAADSPSPAQPAVWVDLGDASKLTPAQQDEIQDAATILHDQIMGSGLAPESPEYRQLWDEAVTDSDRVFRQRYGGQAWMQHHVAAFHMAHPTPAE